MIHSLAGQLDGGKILRQRPFRDPHHSASLVALAGGGTPGQAGGGLPLPHGRPLPRRAAGVPRQTLESLRQPLETGRVTIARANAHVTYPARVQLVAAMNPCRCGHLDDAAWPAPRRRAARSQYQAKISGPLFDRIDLHVDVPAVDAADLALPPPAEGSAEVAARIAAARARQRARYAKLPAEGRPPLQRRGRRHPTWRRSPSPITRARPS